MQETVDFCAENLQKPLAPIIFTGAMRPISFADSDGLQNVTEALSLSQALAPGIYLSFHGEVFRAGTFVKNKKKGMFEKI